MNDRENFELAIEVLLGKIGRLQEARADKLLNPLGMTRPQVAVLEYFSSDPTRRTTVTEMSKNMEFSQPSITRAVSGLLEQRLVKSLPDKVDKRKTQIMLTRKGKNKFNQIVNTLVEDVSRPYRDWRTNDLKVVQRHLDKLYLWLDSNR